MELHKSIFLLFTVMISSDTVQVKNLTGTEGGSITLPDPVEEFGFLVFGKNIAMVNEGRVQIFDEIYKDKVLWDKNTGLFTITGLQRNDSGIYTVDSKKGKFFAISYKLTVYESVPTPAVNVSTESCTLLCSVEKAGELLTLSWYKDEDIVIQNSSALSLSLTVQDFSSSYRCVAANPAEEKTVTVNVKTSCDEENNKDDNSNTDRHYMVWYIIPVVFVVIIICVAAIIKQKYCNKKETSTQDSVNSEQEVQYTEINRVGNRPSQGGHLPDSSGPVDRSNLTTVYDKLEAHRMVDSDTADHVYDQTYPQA